MSRVYKRGDVYYADYRENGRRVRECLGQMSHKDAMTALKAIVGKAVLNRCGIISNDYPVAELRAAYDAFSRQVHKPSTVRRYRAAIDNILGFLEVDLVSGITPSKVIHYREWRLAQPARWLDLANPKFDRCRPESSENPRRIRVPSDRKCAHRTVNAEVICLGTLLNFGVGQELIGSNPIDIKPLSEDVHAKERRALTVDEVTAILTAATDHYRPIWRALLTTGMRTGELAALRFVDIDWELREFIVRRWTTKNHTERRIPIEDSDVWSDLIQRRDSAELRQPGGNCDAYTVGRTQHLFTRDHIYVTEANTKLGNNLRERFYATCRRAGVEVAGDVGKLNAVDLHALRGTFATHSSANGSDIAALGAVTGHKDVSVLVNKYTKALESTKRRAVACLPWANPLPESAATVPIDGHKCGTKAAQQRDRKSKPLDSKSLTSRAG